jgi:hypothetical protein
MTGKKDKEERLWMSHHACERYEEKVDPINTPLSELKTELVEGIINTGIIVKRTKENIHKHFYHRGRILHVVLNKSMDVAITLWDTKKKVTPKLMEAMIKLEKLQNGD